MIAQLNKTEMPSSIDTEKLLLSSAMIWVSREVFASNGITKKSFYDVSNWIIFEAIQKMRDRKQEVEVVLLWEEIKKLWYDADMAYLYELSSLSLSLTSAPGYAKTVRDCERQRTIIQLCDRIKNEALSREEPDTIFNEIRTKLYSYLNEEDTRSDTSIEETIDNVIAELETGEVKPICLTWYHTLDKLVQGYWEWQLWTIAWATGQGKTTISLNLFLNVIKQRVKTAFFTIEMSKEEIVRKMLSNVADVNYNFLCWKIDNGVLDTVKTVWVSTLTEYKDYINIVDNCSKYSDVVNKIYDLADKGVKIFYIDYIQLVAGNKSISRQLEIGEMTSWFKRLANELKVTIVILSQINRGSGKDRPDWRPTLQDLSRSSSIEHDSTVVIMLFSTLMKDGIENCYDDIDKKTLEMLVRKNRFGALGTAPVFFDRDKSKVYNIPDNMIKDVLDKIY